MNIHDGAQSSRFSASVSRLAAIVAALTITTAANGQAQRIDLYVDGGRPVARAIQLLVENHPIVITYEDPRYVYADDLRDVTQLARNPQKTSLAGRVWVPAGGTPFNLSYDVKAATNVPADVMGTLSQLLSMNDASGAGGRFRLEQAGGVIHVVPSAVRGIDGAWISQGSILDILITIPEQSLNGFAMVIVICDALSAAAGIPVTVATVPINLLAKYEGLLAADNEPARHVLVKTLQSVNSRLAWRLLYGPDVEYYGLNIRAVAAHPVEPPTAKKPPASPPGLPPHLNR